jgi:predicted RND superfamily exporter protein
MWLAMSLYGWLDIPINIITMIVPLLFIINFFSFAIHLITKQTLDLNEYLKKKIPQITTSELTNIIGFGSLMLSNIHVIYQFGVLTSLGIIAGLLVLFLIGTPLIVRFIDINEQIVKQDWMNRLLDAYYNKLSKSLSWFVVIIMVALIIIGVIIFPTISVDTNSIGFMKPGNKVRQAEEYIDKNYGSVNIIDFSVDKINNQPFSKEDWRRLSEVRQHLNTLPFIKSASGYDIWRPLIDRLHANDPAKAVQLSEGLLTKDKLHSRLAIQMPSGTVNEMKLMLQETETEINKIIKGSLISIKAVGYLPLYIEQMNTIVSGMIENLSVALLLILLVMSIFVRNLKIGIITTVITVFPLCAVAILMKTLSINFDIATSVISSVLVGMIADDALHIIWSFKKNIRIQKKQPANIIFADSVRSIVHPCTATSIMFAIGFAVLMISNISSIVNFGILSTSVIVFAWIGDFLFFPAVLKLFYPVQNPSVQ